MKKKYKIKGLKDGLSLLDSSGIINKYRYKVVKKRTEQYLSEPSEENLHELRISIRRLRYSLENFGICYSKNEFLMVIEYLKFLQDIIGELRDLDVLPEKIRSLINGNKLRLPQALFSAIDAEKESKRARILLELEKFLKNKAIREFFKSN